METVATIIIVFILVLLVSILLFLRYCHQAHEADWGNAISNTIDGMNRLLCRRIHRLDYQPLPLPPKGPALVVANHVSGLDPLLLISASPRPLRFLIAKEEYERFGFRWIFRLAGCIPVDRKQRPDLALLEARRALAKGDVVALFPHGRIHLDSDPPRKLKQGVAKLAQWQGCPIIPVRLDDIAGAGETFAAVLQRGNPRLRVYDEIRCEKLDSSDCMARIRAVIENRSPN